MEEIGIFQSGEVALPVEQVHDHRIEGVVANPPVAERYVGYDAAEVPIR